MEQWKPVKSKPGIMASSYGRIMLPATESDMPNGGKRMHETKPVWGTKTKSSKNASHVYMGMYAVRYGNLKVHQLVCEAFHGPKPEPKSVVIHIDEDATNNRAENLKWGTQKENLNAPGFLEYCKSRTGQDSPTVKAKKKAAWPRGNAQNNSRIVFVEENSTKAVWHMTEKQL